MNAYLLLPLIQTLFCLALVLIVLRGHFQSFTHRLFSLFLLGLAIWGLVIFGMRASPDIEHAYFWERWLLPVGPLISVLFYHFSVRYTAAKIKAWFLPFLYAISLFFLPLAATDLIISGMQIKPFGYAPIFGPGMLFWMLFSYVVLLMALLNFIGTYRTSAYAEQRNRAAYIVIGIGFALVGGVFDILPVLGLSPYPGVIIGNIVFCLLATVAIVRYNLLDIHIILRKGTTYILMSALIAIPFVGSFLLVTNVFVEGGFPSWAYFVLAIILALVLPHLWQRVQRQVDRWFYRDRYDYLKALETFSRETQSVTESARPGSTMVNLVAGVVRAAAVYLLQALPPKGDFGIVSAAGVDNPTHRILLKSESPLIKWLRRSDGMLSYDDLDIIPQLQGVITKDRGNLQGVGARLIVPLKTRTGQLSGLLILGQKLSGRPYTAEDKQLLYTLSSQIAINLENARLYNDALQARENLETWLDTMSDCVMIVNTDYIIQFANKAAAEKIGSKVGEMCWNGLGKDARCRSCPVQHYLRNNKEGYHYVSDIRGKQYDVAVAPLLNPDSSTSVLEVLRDITERKEAEEREKELQTQLYLSSRLASIGELAAGIAHEINNPLTGVLGFSQRLLRKSTDRNTKEGLEIIHNEAQRAAKVVENLLTFARRHEPKKEYSSINDILQRALELRGYELQTGNIEIVTDLAPGLPEIIVDSYQIQEVFLNIILNAEQAMTEANRGGKLCIKTKEMKGYIRISFTDDGPGIPAEHLDKVFDPFFTTRTERGGTGLGLSVCHGILVEHGGKIYAKSKPQEGTTFFVELPLTTEKVGGRTVVKEQPIRRSE